MSADKVRIPKQKRSIEIKKKIKVTAQELFSEKGYYNTSSNEIVKAAGSSIGAFYSYFSDKKALFIEILHEYNQNIVAQVQVKTIQDDDPKIIIRQYILAVLDAHSYSPEFHREILAMTYADEEIRNIVDHYEAEMIKQIAQLLNRNRKLIRVTDTNNAAFLIFKSVEEVVHSIRIFSHSCDESAIIRELTDMICSYVLK
nr:TetR/AcrR family transcriptional regulator [uncultured Caproiciproducens sp.]